MENAKAMPMSASCVINRSDLLARLDEVGKALPGSLAQAQELIGGREQVVAQAQEEARRIVEAARAERTSLVEGTEVVQQAQAEAGRILAEARREAAEIKLEADDYVDSKLANFEVVLGKTIASVDRGRNKLLGQGGDPERLLDDADAYVEAQFGAIEAVLSKTLEAVGRGRQKLTGHRPSDELGDHFGPQDPDARADQAAENYGQERQAAGTPEGYHYPQPAADEYAYEYSAPGQPEQPGYQGAAFPTPAYQGYDYGDQRQPDGYPAQAAAAGYGEPDPYGYQQPQQGYPGDGRLDETSFFDTGMIDAEALRRYEQGR